MLLLLHLLQSSQDLAWQMSSLLVSLVIQIQVWLVVPSSLFIIILCHHSLTHLFTPGQDLIGLSLMTTLLMAKMITRSQGIKLLQTLIFFFLDPRSRNWIKASRLITEDPRSRNKIGLKLQGLYLFCQFLSVRSVRPVLCSSELQSVIIPFFTSLDLRKYCNECY
jgi:hypothetical protein